MNSSRIAARYAKGLFRYAEQKGVLRNVFGEVSDLLSRIDSSVAFSLNKYLASPTVTTREKLNAVFNLFGLNEQSYLVPFIRLMISKHREGYLYNALLLFRKYYLQQADIRDVIVETPVAISEKEIEQFRHFIEKFFGTPSEITIKINPDLIGGFVVIVDGKILDRSIAGELARIRKHIKIA